MLKAIFFDWSGVILDDFEIVHKTVLHVARHFKNDPEFFISLDELRQAWEIPQDRLYRKWGIYQSLEELNFIFKAKYSSFDTPPLIEGSVQFLNWLSQDTQIPAYIVSAHFKDLLEKELESYGIRHHFIDVMASTDSEAITKETAIKKVLQSKQIQPHETLFIGDTTYDIKSGKATGVKTVGILTGYHSRARLQEENPDHIVENLMNFRYLVENYMVI